MKKIDELLQFLWERRTDNRVSINKDIKYGYRNYYIRMEIDDEPEQVDNTYSTATLRGIFKGYSNNLSIHIDNRNNCINIQYNSNIVVEDDTLIQKWSSILEEYIVDRNEEEFDKIIERAFSDCYRKDFHRDWKMKKIFDEEDESL
jgi:hypothetical protein